MLQIFLDRFRSAESLRDATSERRSVEVISSDKNPGERFEFVLNRGNALRMAKVILRQRAPMPPDVPRRGRAADAEHFDEFVADQIRDFRFFHLHKGQVERATSEAGHQHHSVGCAP